MTTKQKNNANVSFSPHEASQRELVVAILVKRMVDMTKEEMDDITQLGAKLGNCDSQEVYDDITQTIREIMFPEIVGPLYLGSAGPEKVSDKLQKRMNWIGGRIKKFRKEKGHTQQDLGILADLPQGHISLLERGKHSPSHKTLLKIATALGIKVGELDPAQE